MQAPVLFQLKSQSPTFNFNAFRLDSIILPNRKDATTNSTKLRFDESSRTSLTGLSVLLRNAVFSLHL